MTTQGTVTEIHDTQEWQGAKGVMKSKTFLISTGGDYPSNQLITLQEKKIDILNSTRDGDKVEIDFNADSYKNKAGYWNTNLKAYAIRKV